MVYLFLLLAYLLGSIPTAVWIGKAWYKIDIREHGSKNAGATNTFRVLGKKAGRIVLLIDIAKGILATLVPALVLSPILEAEEVIKLNVGCAILAVVGHVFPIFAGFRGGKGVATSLGVVIGLQPAAALICLGIFLVVFLSSKYVSLSAISAAVAFPFVILLVNETHSLWLIGFSILLSFLVIVAHKKNIKRLIKGEESKMNLFKK